MARTKWLERILGGWLIWAHRLRFGVVIFWIALAALGAWLAVTRLGVNTDTSEMISPDAPYRVDDARFQAAFPNLDDQMLILVRAPSPDAVDAAARALKERLEGTEAISSVFAPSYDPFFEQNGLLFLSVSELEDTLAKLSRAAPLIEGLNADPSLERFFDALAQAADAPDASPAEQATMDALFTATAETMTAAMAGDDLPLSWQLLFRDDIEAPYQTALTVTPVLDYSLLKPAKPALAAIRAAVADLEVIDDVGAEIFVTGDPALRADELESVTEGIGLAFAASAVFVGLLMYFAFRSARLSFLAFFSIVISILVTAGFAALVFAELNLVSIAFTVLLVGLGVDFAIHLLLHLRAEQARGLSMRRALAATARDIGAPLILTAPTTAIAFFAFAPTRFVGMTQLGVVSGVGVLIAFVVATSFLPAVSAHLPAPKAVGGTPGHLRRRVRPPLVRVLGVLVGLLGIAAMFALPQARFDADPMALRDPGAPSVRAFNLLFQQTSTTPYRLDLLTETPEAAQTVAENLEALAPVEETRTLFNFVPKDQFVKRDLIDFAGVGIGFAVAEGISVDEIEPDVVARLQTALSERGGSSAETLSEAIAAWQALSNAEAVGDRVETNILRFWPDQLRRLRAQMSPREVTLDSLPQALTDRYVGTNGQYRVEIIPAGDVRDPEARQAFVDAARSVAPTVTGPARNVLEAGAIIQGAMIQAGLVAVALVSLLLLVVLRDLALVIVMMIPLAMAGALTTATGAFVGLPYNFANVIVLPLLIGVGIDSGIHLAMRARKSDDPSELTQSVTARAVFFSAVTTIASFGSLAFSAHQGTASMGLLLMIAIGWTLATTLFVLPVLMEMLLHRRIGGRSNR